MCRVPLIQDFRFLSSPHMPPKSVPQPQACGAAEERKYVVQAEVCCVSGMTALNTALNQHSHLDLHIYVLVCMQTLHKNYIKMIHD